MNDLTIVMPVFNEDVRIVTELYLKLEEYGFPVIVVDDGSHMDLPDYVNVLTYPANVGYGHAIKFGLQNVKTPYVCTMDGDSQHRPEDVYKLYKVFKLIKDCKMLVGCRWNLEEKAHRWWGRKVINFIASLWAKHMLLDLNSGMRIFDTKTALDYSPILCDTFSFTTSLTMCMVTDGHKVAWFPIDVMPRAIGKSRVKLVRDGLITLFYIFYIGFALRTRKIRALKRRILGK